MQRHYRAAKAVAFYLFFCFLFFIFRVALCFVTAARTDSERNEEKYRKEMKKITPLVIFKFLILESLICYCHSNLGRFYYAIIAPFLADNGWQRYRNTNIINKSIPALLSHKNTHQTFGSPGCACTVCSTTL